MAELEASTVMFCLEIRLTDLDWVFVTDNDAGRGKAGRRTTEKEFVSSRFRSLLYPDIS
jgi:hypothetical protein